MVLTSPGHAGRTDELAGDQAAPAQEFAAEVGKQVGKEATYTDVPEKEYQEIFEQVGLPPMLTHLVADSDTKTKEGQLLGAETWLYKHAPDCALLLIATCIWFLATLGSILFLVSLNNRVIAASPGWQAAHRSSDR